MSENKKKIPIKIKLKTSSGETPSTPQPKTDEEKTKFKVDINPNLSTNSSSPQQSEGASRTGGYQGNRPYQGNNQNGERTGGYQGNRPYQGNNQNGERTGGYQGNRPYQGNNQNGERTGGYQGNRPYQGNNQNGERTGGYQGNRPYQGNNQNGERTGGYQGNRPYQGNNQNGERTGGYQGNRPYQGNNQNGERTGGYQGNRPYQGNNQNGERTGGYQGNRPYQGNNQNGERTGGYQGNRPYQGNNQNGERTGGYQGNRPYQGNNQNGERTGGYQGNRPYQGNNQNGERTGGYQGNRPGGFQNRGPGGGQRPAQKDSIGPENTKKDFLSAGNKQRTVKTDFKKKKDFTSSYDKEVSFELHHRKKKSSSAAIPSEVEIYDTVLVSELAAKMNLKASDLISKLLNLGYIATINDALDAETAEIIASEYGCHVKVKSYQEELNEILSTLAISDKESILRSPVVTIMGHVDHGKTTLLDYIRKAHVASGEAGGITQHIGAYQIEHNGRKITFIDTPGHEAFTAMRSRGASITDIVILVVAADDGIMPQTIEALNHAKASKVPTIVAINKIDKEIKNIEGIKSQLSEHGLIPEDWGGDTMFIGVSALKGTGVSDLLDAIILNTDIKEFKANPENLAKGVILESKMDKSRGSIATVIVQDGTLKKGDIFVAGTTINRVRAMFNHSGNEVLEAGPSTPIEVLGFENVPEAGDMLYVTPSERVAKVIVDKKKAIRIAEHAKKITKTDNSLDVLFQKIQEQGKVDFNVIVKADVQGTVEAIKGMLEKLASQIQEVNLKIIHAAVGAITENDILLASTSGSLVVGFNVRVNNDKTNRLAKTKGVEVRRYSIIYEITNDIKDAIEGILQPEQSEKITGEATVRQVFKIPKVGLIAGSYVNDGIIKMNSQVRVIRDGVVECTSKIITLKHFKEDVKEAKKGFECGIEIANFKSIKEGDVIETFEIVHTSKKLELVDKVDTPKIEITTDETPKE